MSDHKYQLQLTDEPDNLVAVDVASVPREAIPEWIIAVRQIMQQAGYQLPAIQFGNVRIVPEEHGCRVGHDNAPMSSMQWFDSLPEGLGHAEKLRSESGGAVRTRVRDEADARARRIMSRMLTEGMTPALTEELAESHADLQDEIRRLRQIKSMVENEGVNLKAHQEPDGNISVSAVATTGEKTAAELAREAAQYLGPLLMTYADMHRVLGGNGQLPREEPYEEEEEGWDPDKPAVFQEGLADSAIQQILEAFNDGQEIFEFADIEMQIVMDDDGEGLRVTLDRKGGSHNPPLAGMGIRHLADDTAEVRLRCRENLELLPGMTALAMAFGDTEFFEEEETNNSLDDMVGPAFPDAFPRNQETGPGGDHE